MRSARPGGAINIGGGGLLAAGDLALQNTVVSGNTGLVNGPPATAIGGGIRDTPIPNGPAGGPLVLVNSRVLDNRLSGSPGAAILGGGIFAASQPVTLTNSQLAGNLPHQCFGC